MVPSQVSGYIQYVGYSQLIAIATRTDSVIRLEHRPGHYLATGRPLAFVWPRAAAPEVALALSKAHVTGPHRTLVQDPVFAIDQLVEIAIRALSAAVNDTFTALTCIDWLSAGLGRVSGRVLDEGVYRDAAGKVRLIEFDPSYARMVNRAFDKIRQRRPAMPAVLIRLIDSLGSIMLDTTSAEQRTVLRRQADMVLRLAEETVTEPNDLEEIRFRYRRLPGEEAFASISCRGVRRGSISAEPRSGSALAAGVVGRLRGGRGGGRRRGRGGGAGAGRRASSIRRWTSVPSSSWSCSRPSMPAAVVVVVAGGAAGGATKGTVSPRMVARLAVGVAERLVQLRAAFQLWTAVVAGAPVSGWGTPLRSWRGARRRRDVPALRGDDEGAAVGLGGRVVVEGEVAQAVVDVGTAEIAAAQEDVGAGADHDVGPRLDQLLGQRFLLGVRAGLRLGAPVHVDDHGVRRLPRLLDRAAPAGSGRSPRPRRVGSTWRSRCVTRLSAMTWVAAKMATRCPLIGDPVGREGLRRGVADAEDGILAWWRSSGLRQSLRPAVHAVVVGLGGDRHRGALSAVTAEAGASKM